MPKSERINKGENKMKYAINGRFLARKTTGQERFAREIVSEIDKIVEPQKYCMVVPKYVNNRDIPNLKNISIIKYGKIKKHLWEQISFYSFIKKNNLTSINLTTTCPFFKPDITCIHDISYHVNKNWFKSFYGRLSTIWHKLLANSVFKKSTIIFTVSNFSRNQMINICHADGNKITVLGNGWDHFKRIKSDENIFQKFPKLMKKQYILSVSSITPQKNFKWIKSVAKRNPTFIFAVVGAKEKLSNCEDFNDIPENMHFLGRVSDSEIKSLMENCLYFIHPALFEGFGITPMEALSVGAKVLVSDIPVFREVYGDSVYYFDPNNPNFDLSTISFDLNVECINDVLNKFTWKNMAQKMIETIKAEEMTL